jgi:hypothetical protein
MGGKCCRPYETLADVSLKQTEEHYYIGAFMYFVHWVCFAVVYTNSGGPWEFPSDTKPWPHEYLWYDVMDGNAPAMQHRDGSWFNHIHLFYAITGLGTILIGVPTFYGITKRASDAVHVYIMEFGKSAIMDTALFFTLLGVMMQGNVWTRVAMCAWYITCQSVKCDIRYRMHTDDKGNTSISYGMLLSDIAFLSIFFVQIIMLMMRHHDNFNTTALIAPWMFIVLEMFKFTGFHKIGTIDCRKETYTYGTCLFSSASRLVCWWLCMYPVTPYRVAADAMQYC